MDHERENKKKTRKLSPDELYLESLNSLSPLDRFIRMMIDELRKIFYRYDFDKNLVFTED